MAGAKPELVIPLRLDNAQMLKDLAKAGQAGKQMGADVGAGMKGASAEARGLGSDVGDLIKAQMSLGAVKQVGTAIANSFKESSQYIQKMAEDFQKLRGSMASVASLSGQGNNTKFTLDELDKAQKANVTPGEHRDFRNAFLGKASLYIGEGKDAKMSTKDADEFQAAMEEYAKQKGVSQQEMAGFAGGLLAQQKGPTTAAEMKAKAGKVFATLEASSADVGHLLPMMTRVMAQGFSAEEAAPTLAMMPEIAPEEEGTYTLRALSAIREKAQKGEGEEFGVSKGMRPYEMLTNAVAKIKERGAAGEDVEDMIAKLTGGEEVAGRAIRGMVDQGPEGMQRWKDLVDNTPDNALDAGIAAGRQTDQGLQNSVDSRQAIEQARAGARNDVINRRRQIAETEATAGGEFERFQGGQAIVGAITEPFGAESQHDRIINRQMLQRGRAEAGESYTPADEARTLSNKATDDLMRELLVKIEANTRKAEERPPLVQKPPNPQTRP